MGLSENEQRILEEMERALYQADPDFRDRVSVGRTLSRPRATIAVLGILVGLGTLLAGAIIPAVPVGLVGFTMMLACTTLLVQTVRQRRTDWGAPEVRLSTPTQFGDGFMRRLEDRWNSRRQDTHDEF